MASKAATLGQAGLPQLDALNGGIQAAFSVAALISIATVVLAFFIRNTKPPMDEQSRAYEHAAGDEPISDEAAATRA
jgi:hypothetical protein